MLNRRLLRIKIYQGLYAMHNLQLRVEEQGKTLIANHFFVPYEERPEEYDADIDSARTLLATSIFQDHLGLLSIPNEISTDLEPAVFEIVLRALRFYREELSRVNQNLFQNLVFETVIYRNSRLGEAPSQGKPVVLYDADSKGAENYMEVSREILQNNDGTKIKNSEKIINLEENE